MAGAASPSTMATRRGLAVLSMPSNVPYAGPSQPSPPKSEPNKLASVVVVVIWVVVGTLCQSHA